MLYWSHTFLTWPYNNNSMDVQIKELSVTHKLVDMQNQKTKLKSWTTNMNPCSRRKIPTIPRLQIANPLQVCRTSLYLNQGSWRYWNSWKLQKLVLQTWLQLEYWNNWQMALSYCWRTFSRAVWKVELCQAVVKRPTSQHSTRKEIYLRLLTTALYRLQACVVRSRNTSCAVTSWTI